MAEGWASPLSGFMRERQYLQCLHSGQILDLKRGFPDSNDLQNIEEKKEFQLLESINQSIPIVLAITSEQRKEILKRITEPIRLIYNNKLIALMHDSEIYPHRKEERIHRQFGYYNTQHPTIQMINDQGDWLIGGDLEVGFLFILIHFVYTGI